MRMLFIILTISLVALGCHSEKSKDRSENDWILVKGGEFTFGEDGGLQNEGPAVVRRVAPYYLSRTEVTNTMFAAFVSATGYVTDAEKANKGGLLYREGWKIDSTATWQHPHGANSNMLMDHPVVQVSYNDALAYCKWKGARLPSELEFEFAMKTTSAVYEKRNVWTGIFPIYNNENDGYLYTAPVNAYADDRNQFTHLSGNVWEWCADSYHMEIHDKQTLQATAFPYQGVSFDPSKLDDKRLKVIKGGSFMCHESYCAGYRSAARQSAVPNEAYFHVGFRVAKDKI